MSLSLSRISSGKVLDKAHCTHIRTSEGVWLLQFRLLHYFLVHRQPGFVCLVLLSRNRLLLEPLKVPPVPSIIRLNTDIGHYPSGLGRVSRHFLHLNTS